VSAPVRSAPVRVLIADPCAATRGRLVALCGHDTGISVVGEAVNGAQAAELARLLRPSLVLMDVGMPGLDGVECTKLIMRESPTPIIVLTNSTSAHDVEAGLRAVRHGALTVLPKPSAPTEAHHPAGHGTGTGHDLIDERAGRHLVSMVKALSDVKVVRRRSDRSAAARSHDPSPRLQIIGIAASTGGPPALARLMQELPADLPVPMVVVQHIVEGFLPGLVAWLGADVPFRVALAAEGQHLVPGTVYLAGDGHHLEVDAQLRAHLTSAPPVAGFRPSATVLFASMARALGPAAIGVVLTGMGTDGLEGLRELRSAGGRVLAQDQQTSVVNGMPGAVVAAGLAHVVGPVTRLAADLSERARRRQ
jgi:two-component system, chemotaxis family, protein-glutamate methylesterase/glutaminase